MGGMLEGDTEMTRTKRLLVRAILCALLLLSLSASVARADSSSPAGCSGPADVLPEDPGLD